jgi:multimeric flavodoxin WrbA
LDLDALYINCTLKPSPQLSNTQGLIDVSAAIMRKHGVRVDVTRAIDHDIATGVWPDMTEHGAAADAWPDLYAKVLAADILIIAGPIWLGDNSSVTKRVANGSTPAPTCSTTPGSTLTTAGPAAA